MTRLPLYLLIAMIPSACALSHCRPAVTGVSQGAALELLSGQWRTDIRYGVSCAMEDR